MIHRVLLVDDDDDLRTVAALCLSRIGGWETLIAPDGATALQLAVASMPDVVLLDVMMPGMDGFAVLAKLREDRRTARIPVVFLTAAIQRGQVGDYVARGAVGAIVKPFDPLRLPAEVTRLVSRAGARA